MSVLTGKHILVVGDETDQISKVEAALITYGATITSAPCHTVDFENITAQDIDLILLNHMHEGSHCRTMLQQIQQAELNKVIPVLVLVQNDNSHINDAFMLGATDFLTPAEDPHQIVEKMKAIFGDTTHAQDDAAIDITPKEFTSDAGIRVFALEDDPLLNNLLAARFKKSNLPFKIVSDGDHVVEQVVAFQPQIIILDLMLPDKDGFVVLQELKASAAADVPVIIFSNKDSQEDREKVKALGAAAFYVKAMTDLSELLDVIKKFAKA
jgi:DNA-binding response OmpR family regulator